jgi:GAF domain-containing protein
MVVENRSFDQPNAETELAVQQRLKALSELGLLEASTIPVFEAATQTAADFLEVPICILGFIDENCHWFKSAVGLSRLGLMNQLAIARSLPREESFCSYVVTSQQSLAINDTHNERQLLLKAC